MSDPKKPGGDEPEDDGWGAAADSATPAPAPKPEPVESEEWKDPANLEERVAALRASEQRPAALPPTEVPPTEVPPTIEVADELKAEAPAETPGGSDAPPTPEPSEIQAVVSDEDAPQWAPPIAPDMPADEQPLPAPSSDMLAAAGVIAKKNADPKAKKAKKPEDPKKAAILGYGLTRKQATKLIGGAVALVLAGVVAILGWLNSKNYYLVCDTKTIRAEQGRFWPWGQNSLPGPAFRSITIPSDVLCQSENFDNRLELENAFLAALLEQSTNLLTSGGAEQVDVAEAQLVQALLLTRGPQRAEERELAERLQGDVSYWRGAAEVQRAVEVLNLGASSFEEAAGKRPRHSSDASAWAEHARYLSEEIDKGPRSLRADEAPKEKPHFGGLTDPKDPPTTDSGAPTPPITPETPMSTQADAGVPTEPPADADVPPIDAALPRGGVLL